MDLGPSQCNQHIGKIWVCRDRLLSLPKKGDRKDPWKPFCSYERELLHRYSCVCFPLATSDPAGHGGPPADLKMGEVAETLVHGESYQDQAHSGR